MEFSQILELMKPLFEAYAGKYGTLVQVLAVVGSFRVAMKPVFAAIEKFVYETESKKDDAMLGQIKESKIVKIVMFLLDYVASIKLPR